MTTDRYYTQKEVEVAKMKRMTERLFTQSAIFRVKQMELLIYGFTMWSKEDIIKAIYDAK